MQSGIDIPEIELFSTAPPIAHESTARYIEQVTQVARWSEAAGCRGILIYSDNSQADPWLVAHAVIQGTRALCPLVAVQPLYMHPYTVAKLVATLAALYGRRVYLNMLAGGFVNDLAALGDRTSHDQRYGRLMEYSRVILQLLCDDGPVTHNGAFYQVHDLRLRPQCPEELYPGVLMAGSSEAALKTAEAIGATAVQYPSPAHEWRATDRRVERRGLRIGIIAREDSSHAWDVAHRRFPEDRKGKLTHQLAMKVSDSVWHRQLSELGVSDGTTPYWLVPFEHYKTMCPYLVGSHREVGTELASYIAMGYRTFITDIPSDPEDLDHIRTAFEFARRHADVAIAAQLGQRAGAAPA